MLTWGLENRQKLPQKIQDKTPQELSNYMEREFEAAILKPYGKILTNYKEWEAFIREQRVQRDELKQNIDLS